jgi:uncharacterized protein YjiS (DUF1127 family)
MLTVNQDKIDRSIVQGLGSAFLAPLVFIGDWLGLYKAFHWLQDERRRNAVIRELNLVSDYYLNDVGIKRSDIDSIADEMVKRLREGVYDPR